MGLNKKRPLPSHSNTTTTGLKDGHEVCASLRWTGPGQWSAAQSLGSEIRANPKKAVCLGGCES